MLGPRVNPVAYALLRSKRWRLEAVYSVHQDRIVHKDSALESASLKGTNLKCFSLTRVTAWLLVSANQLVCVQQMLEAVHSVHQERIVHTEDSVFILLPGGAAKSTGLKMLKPRG